MLYEFQYTYLIGVFYLCMCKVIWTPASDRFPNVLFGCDDESKDDENTRGVATIEPISEGITPALDWIRNITDEREKPIHPVTSSC